MSDFIVDSNIKYGCTACGECCKEPWLVPVEKTAQESIAHRDWSGTRLESQANQDSKFFLQPSSTVSTGAVFQTCNQTCVFHSEQGQCDLHEKFGVDAKGAVCRLFPYLFIQAPEGIYQGYSFVCRTVRDTRALEEAELILEESPQAHFDEAFATQSGIHYQVAPESVLLDRDVELSWENYLILEEGLLDLLNQKRPFQSLMVGGHAYLSMATLYLQEFSTLPEEDVHLKLKQYVEAMKTNEYQRIFGITQKSKARFAIRRYVLSVMLGLDEAGHAARIKRLKQERKSSLSRTKILSAGFRCFLSPYPTNSFPEGLLDSMVKRYFCHVIWRKGLALGKSLYRLGGLLREYSMLSVMYALIEYYAGINAKKMEPQEAIAEAIRKVERDFVLHAGKDATGPDESEHDSFDLFLTLLDQLVHSKTFVPSMVNLKR